MGWYGSSKMGLQVLLKSCNTVQCSKVSPVGAQSGDKMRLVLILVATDYHQAIV